MKGTEYPYVYPFRTWNHHSDLPNSSPLTQDADTTAMAKGRHRRGIPEGQDGIRGFQMRFVGDWDHLLELPPTFPRSPAVNKTS